MLIHTKKKGCSTIIKIVLDIVLFWKVITCVIIIYLFSFCRLPWMKSADSNTTEQYSFPELFWTSVFIYGGVVALGVEQRAQGDDKKSKWHLCETSWIAKSSGDANTNFVFFIPQEYQQCFRQNKNDNLFKVKRDRKETNLADCLLKLWVQWVTQTPSLISNWPYQTFCQMTPLYPSSVVRFCRPDQWIQWCGVSCTLQWHYQIVLRVHQLLLLYSLWTWKLHECDVKSNSQRY